MNSFYLIDKPIWITSFDVIRRLRKILWVKNIWHTWTLDPLATGCLLVAIWNYTKLISFFDKDTKEYIFKIWLDWKTKSFDLWTEVEYISNKDKKIFENKLDISYLNIILRKNFIWKINQLPPKYSALKIWGKRAFDLVRKWEEFELKKREITIYSIEILDYKYPDLILKALVSSWTYIRSIAYDLWNIIWSWGYVKELRRSKIGKLDVDNSMDLDDFKENWFLNIEDLFWKDNFIELDQDILSKLDNWLSFKYKLDLDNNQKYFIKDWDFITNIVSYTDWFLIPRKKIL